jgi:hypothetical protein
MSGVRDLLPALGASFAFTLAGGGDKLAFQPAAGSTLTKSYTIGGEFTLDDISLIVDGQDLGGMLEQFEVSVKTDSRIEIKDAYRAVAGGRPTDLLRTFDALTSTVHVDMTPAQPEMPEFTSSSSLEGKTVAFRWNEDEHEYERSFHEHTGDEELLEGLEEDMDLRAFLPPGEVSDGDTWTVELSKLESLVAPGGNLRMIPEKGDMDDEAMEKFEEMFKDFDFGDMLEGDCTCTFKGAHEEGGVRVAEIAIEIEVSATMDLSELLEKAIRAAIEEGGAEEKVDVSLDTADFNLDFQGKGTLLWSLGAGRVHSFQISGESTIDIDLSVGVEDKAGGESHDLDASLELTGSMHEEVAAKE